MRLDVPTRADVTEVARRTAARVERILRARGRSLDPQMQADDPHAFAIDEPGLANFYAASAQGISLAGEGAGKPTLRLVVSQDSNTGALDTAGREALLRYILRPPIAQERVEPTKDGLVRIALKRAFSDGTVAVEMDPLSLLCRLAMTVPPPRYHTVKYAGVLASASKWLARIAPKRVGAASVERAAATEETAPTRRGCKYRLWADLLRRPFAIDVLECPKCKGRMKLVAMVTEAKSLARFLASTSEPLEPPTRAPSREPPYWASTVLRRKAFGNVA